MGFTVTQALVKTRQSGPDFQFSSSDSQSVGKGQSFPTDSQSLTPRLNTHHPEQSSCTWAQHTWPDAAQAQGPPVETLQWPDEGLVCLWARRMQRHSSSKWKAMDGQRPNQALGLPSVATSPTQSQARHSLKLQRRLWTALPQKGADGIMTCRLVRLLPAHTDTLEGEGAISVTLPKQSHLPGSSFVQTQFRF